MPDTPDMKIWREEFDAMSLEEHHNKLKALGLGEEDLKEFDEDFKGENSSDAKETTENFKSVPATKKKGKSG